MSTIRSVFPEFSRELTELVALSEHPQLAEQVPHLPVLDRCRCGQSECAHFYTAPRPGAAYGPGHFNVPLGTVTGLIILDVVNDRIVAVEVLGRSDVKHRLDAFLPSPGAPGR
jgi:hypothetical protein